MIANGAAQAQNPYDTGTPVEAKGGASWFSAYAPDKLENVNLANGNFMVNIPLATVGGRGSVSYTVTLSHHSKLWTSRHNPEVVNDPLGGSIIFHHFQPEYGDGVQTLPNEITLGGGWFILKAPAIKRKTFGIEALRHLPNNGTTWYRYVLTRFWLVLPDGSEIELRDEATQGAPAPGPQPDPVNSPLTDRNRGRVLKSVDGSAITYINDTNLGGLNFVFNGWVLMPDGTRLRIDSGIFDGGRCAKIIDRNGNYINIAYDTPTTGAVTYTDQLGRQVILHGGAGGATVTVKGYNGLADRVYTVETGRIGALDGSGNPTNMRSDYWSVQRPIIAGDYFQHLSNTIEHTYPGPHTDLFFHGENGIVIDDIVTPTKLIMPDGRFFTFRYDKYALLAEIVYPGGGKTQIDYGGGPSDVCEVLNAPFAADVNRRVTQRRVLSNGDDVDAVWLYNIGSFEVRQGSSAGPLLMAETHYFLALNAEYRRCYQFDGDFLDYGSDGTMYPKWENNKVYKVERQTGSGLLTETKNWAQRAPVVWAPDPGSGVNSYAVQYGQEQPSNDDRVTREDSILENGKLKRVEYSYDNFNNVTSVKEYAFGTNPNPGPFVRETVRSYATSLNGSCYSNLNPSDPGCGGGIAADINSIIHMRRLALQESIWDKTINQEQARTIYEYDVYANDGNRAALVDYASVTGHDTVWNAPRAARGNVTQVGNWLKESNTYLHAYPRYDELGNVVATKDPHNNVSSVSFADDFGSGDNPGSGVAGNFGATYAFPTLFTSPPPNPGANPHTARAQYNFSRGTQTGFKDRNNVITKTEYNDPFSRPTKVIAAKGVAGVEAHTSFYYAPDNVHGVALDSNDVMVVKDRDAVGDAILRSWTLTDGFGRAIEGWTRHPQGDVKVTTIYDGLGRAIQGSNPYRNGETPIYTTTNYDLAGRVTTITTPDGATVSTAYNGAQVTVTDQAGKKRRSETDALGRMTRVIEDPGGLGHETTYLYDALGNLRKVTQGAQTRWFAYDSLSRLIRAKNPEQNPNSNLAYTDTVTGHSEWATAYSYDANGNLIERKDARGVIANYSYDALNRNTGTTYTINGSQTRSVEMVYDGAVNGKGRLHYERTQEGGVNATETKMVSYDAVGRPLNKQQSFWRGSDWGTPYVIQQIYDLAGAVKTVTYPSNRTVNYSYDHAGRLNSFTGNLGGGFNKDYATGMHYDAAGSMKREQFGTTIPLYHRRHYNNRGQLFDIRLGTDPNPLYDSDDLSAWQNAPGSWNRGVLKLYYSTLNGCHVYGNGGTDNNGNPLRMDHHIPLNDAVSNFVASIDRYEYDPLNRVKSVTELSYTKGPSGEDIYQGVFRQVFLYDQWGNRTIDQINTTGGVNEKAYTVDTATNRLTSVDGVGMSYDAAGNQTNDGSGQRVYDGENRMVEAYNSAGVRVSWYVYDAAGRRVVRTVGSQGTWHVYGFGGELLAEYAVGASPSAPQKEYGYRGGQLLVVWDGSETGDRQLQWLVQDHLGSTRMVVDRSGSLGGVRRHDFCAFGEELSVGVGIRSAALGYGPDSTRQKFTSKERDAETGLDYFLARYYSSIQGRFTSPDEFQGGPREIFVLGSGNPTKQALPYADITNPQSLNKYVYSYNNPLRYTDPDGHIPVETAIDVVSFAASFYAMVTNPSWVNLGYLVWDGLATVIPYVPGSWVAKIGKYGHAGLKAAGIIGKPLDEFETVVNNKFVREGVGLLGQGDDSVRKVLGLGDDVRTADFLGVKQGGEYVIAETKGGAGLERAVQQLNNTVDALVQKVGDVKFSAEVVLRKGTEIKGEFRLSGNQLEKFNVKTEKWELQKANGKAITVRFE
jgi:RHS repeat-associated protein